ncbi:unnamed protein product [Hymenolepis diminuta]|uniref:Uncharacterized protein n=1 Tax=Hymenolepis diminuta TaxID=6216 RepID=A0A564YGS4_HYMDI|nr:unnamed protein product [Hymenolepis diminuta]
MIYLSTGGTHSPFENYPTNDRISRSKDTDFVENVDIIKTALSKTSLSELQRKWLQRGLLSSSTRRNLNNKRAFNSD